MVPRSPGRYSVADAPDPWSRVENTPRESSSASPLRARARYALVMAVKKKSRGSSTPKKKATAKKKAASGKAAPVKKKAAPKKKAAAKKKAAPEKKAAAKKKAAPKKQSAPKKEAAPKKAAAPKQVAPAAAKEAAAPRKVERPKGSASSMDVTLGHIFTIRPRVNTGFRQHDLFEAKRTLVDEVYANIRDAARAVAEEALSITREAAARPTKHRRR